ncbi:uncharacterized protein B0P05DRAFT_472768 [Gilbertella persicaria]|nr:uncharacterized protein B0P05DRAFT_472768 [Gilbertella persicaria]KAI8075395.1 hypothetical protein B0P05DRAFT_472768 [Gilbertella persicaria]
MFKSTLVFLSLSAVLQLIGASSVTITEPKANDVWKAGSTVQIKWDVNDATSEHIRLQYASGPSQSLTIDGLIADNVKASVGHYKWKVPSDIEAKD